MPVVSATSKVSSRYSGASGVNVTVVCSIVNDPVTSPDEPVTVKVSALMLSARTGLVNATTIGATGLTSVAPSSAMVDETAKIPPPSSSVPSSSPASESVPPELASQPIPTSEMASKTIRPTGAPFQSPHPLCTRWWSAVPERARWTRKKLGSPSVTARVIRINRS